MSGPTIGFAGMTHLGLNSAVAAAERGFETLGYDPDAAVVARLCGGELPVVEPGLEEALAANQELLLLTSDASDLARCDVVYVAPDVSTDDDGQSDLSVIESLLTVVDAELRDDAALVILSQVPPGFTRQHARPGRQLFCQVETLIFGRALERALHPERIIVGCAHPEHPLHEGLAHFLDGFDCPLLIMRYESAELAKIAINCCLVASIGVANTLAELCETIGADWSEIDPALRLDKRIGHYAYLAPGLGIAGGNLERDLATVLRLAASNGTDAGIVAAWKDNSRHRRDWAWRTLGAELPGGIAQTRLAVLGLAYKRDTHSIKNSPALALLERLTATPSCDVMVFDPVVSETVPTAGRHAETAMAAVDDSDAVAIMTPWPVFAELAPAELARRMRGRALLDPYRVLDAAAVAAAGLDYLTLGAPPLRATTKRSEIC